MVSFASFANATACYDPPRAAETACVVTAKVKERFNLTRDFGNCPARGVSWGVASCRKLIPTGKSLVSFIAALEFLLASTSSVDKNPDETSEVDGSKHGS